MSLVWTISERENKFSLFLYEWIHRFCLSGGLFMQAKYWHKRDDGKIGCDLCPRHCVLKTGQRGFCFIRENINSQMVLTSYGKSTGFCIDPVEKKPLNHFYPGSPVLSFGTAGCNLGCKFCQNWDISRSHEELILSAKASPEEIAHVAKGYKCKSVAFTYNDPVIFHEYAVDTAIACRENGVKAIAVTAGYINPEPRKDFFTVMDAANIDLKGFTEDFYKKYTCSHLAPVLDTLQYVKHETNTWLEVTNLIIPGANDSSAEIEQMTKWIFDNLGPDVPLHFSAFHPACQMMDVPRTPPSTLFKARDIALKNGINYVYTGNIIDTASSSTYCDNCGELLIERESYEISKWSMMPGSKCSKCNNEIPGCFEDKPGKWGNKSAPIKF